MRLALAFALAVVLPVPAFAADVAATMAAFRDQPSACRYYVALCSTAIRATNQMGAALAKTKNVTGDELLVTGPAAEGASLAAGNAITALADAQQVLRARWPKAPCLATCDARTKRELK